MSSGIYNLEPDENIIPPYFSAGIHPKDIQTEILEDQFSWLYSAVSDKNCVAIGECGLDQIVPTDSLLQENVFEQHISLSNETKKPLIVHCVKKFYEVIAFRKKAEQAMIIHGFNKKQKVAEDLLEHNFYLSFGKAALYNLSLQKTIELVPLQKMFLETDSADFNIEELYSKVSEIKKISLEQLIDQIKENFYTIQHG